MHPLVPTHHTPPLATLVGMDAPVWSSRTYVTPECEDPHAGPERLSCAVGVHVCARKRMYSFFIQILRRVKTLLSNKDKEDVKMD